MARGSDPTEDIPNIDTRYAEADTPVEEGEGDGNKDVEENNNNPEDENLGQETAEAGRNNNPVPAQQPAAAITPIVQRSRTRGDSNLGRTRGTLDFETVVASLTTMVNLNP